MHAGTGVGLADLTLEAHNVNALHFSKDILYTQFASYILPKGSPLVVSIQYDADLILYILSDILYRNFYRTPPCG